MGSSTSSTNSEINLDPAIEEVKTHLSDTQLNIIQSIDSFQNEMKSSASTNNEEITQLKEDLKNKIDSLTSANDEGMKQIKEKLETITNNLSKSKDSPLDDTGKTIENQDKILSLLNTKKIDMKNVLGLNSNIETTIQHPAIMAYTNLKLCYENQYVTHNPSAPFCNIYSVSARNELDKKLDQISKFVPVCNLHFQSKKFNGAETPLNEKPMSEACEQHLAMYAKKCLDNQFCKECRETLVSAPTACNRCKYENESGGFKFYLQPYCEKLMEEIKGPYMKRQFLYSFAQIDLCKTESCKAYYMQENANYRLQDTDGKQICSNLDFSSKDNLKDSIALESKCKSTIEELRSQYEDECNTYIEGAYNKKNYCTNVLEQIL